MPSNKNAETRYYIIDQLLANRYHNYSIADICDRVNEKLAEIGIKPVTKRTIEYDIKYLEKDPFWVDIERYTVDVPGRKSDSTIVKNCLRYKDSTASIFSQKLTDEEKYILSETLKMLGQFDGLPNLDGLESLKRSLEVPDSQQIISFTRNLLENPHLFGQLFIAITQRQVVKLHLHTFDEPDKPQHIVVHPYMLKEYNRRWYLIASTDSDDRLMNFALDRIDSVEPLPSRKYRNYNGDLAERFEDIIGVTFHDNRPLQNIVFWVSDHSKGYVATKPLHESQKHLRGEKESELRRQYPMLKEGTFFSIDCIENYELIRELTTFGKDLIVLSPKNIQDAVFAMGNEMCDRYREILTKKRRKKE